jgi:hypothetical protein
MARIVSKTPQGDFIITVSTRGDLEVPDDTVEALIEPVENGRPGAPAVAQGRIWSRAWGCLEIKDHVKKQEIAAGEKALKDKQEKAERAKKVDKARAPKKVTDVVKADEPVKRVAKDTETSK